jgi:predicted nucleotidyltransferase
VGFNRPVQSVIPGVQGRILAVLANATAGLSVRSIARLSGVSLAQTSRVLPRLVELGIVTREEIPPSSIFRLAPEHVASQAVMALSRARGSFLDQLGDAAQEMSPRPVGVVLFGSLARGDAGLDSDIDVVIIRPDGVAEDDEAWGMAIDQFRDRGRRLSGHRVEVLELSRAEIAERLRSPGELWASVRREGILIAGSPLQDLETQRSA